MFGIEFLIAFVAFVLGLSEPEPPPGWYCPCFTESEVRSEIEKYPWDVSIMMDIAYEESAIGSRYYNAAISPTNDRCVLQINNIHGYDTVRLRTDLRYCVRAGYEVWQQQGYRAWTTYEG